MRTFVVGFFVFLSACSSARYNLPHTETGLPDANIISRQVRCELIDLMRQDGGYDHRGVLVQNGYVVAADLNLKVNSNGEIVPTGLFFGSDPIGLAVGARLGRDVERTFTQRLTYTTLDYENITITSLDYQPCIQNRENFSGEFGIKTIADLALTTEDRDTNVPFSGSFALTITRNIGGFGPKWIFNSGSDNFSIFGNSSNVQKNTITIIFSKINGIPTPARIEDASARAQDYLDTLLLQRD